MHSRVLWLIAVSLGLFALPGCERASDITDTRVAQLLVGRCLTSRETLFLVARTAGKQKYPEQTGIRLVPPGSPWAPPSIASFESGEVVAGESWRVLRLVPAATTLRTERVWRLGSFEGDVMSIQARLSTGEVADITDLITFEWTLPFVYERKVPPSDPPFDMQWLADCDTK